MSIHPYKAKTGKLYRYHFQVGLQRFTKRGFASQREAKDAEAEHRRQVYVGLTGQWPTFSELAKDYLGAAARRSSAEWIGQQVCKLNKHAATIANLPPREIRPIHVERLLRAVAKNGNGPASINEVRKILHGVFQYAVNIGGLERNPVSTIRRVPQPFKEPRAIPTEDLRRLMVSANPALARFLTVQACTGARWREIARLTPADVRLDAKPSPYVLLRSGKSGGRGIRARVQYLPATAADALQSQVMERASALLRWWLYSPLGAWLGKR